METASLSNQYTDISIRSEAIRAATEREKSRIYALRQSVLASRRPVVAGASCQDELDAGAEHRYVMRGGRTVAALRIHCGFKDNVPKALTGPHDLSAFSAYATSEFSFTTRIVVDPDYCRSNVMLELMSALYRMGRSRKLRFDFLFASTEDAPFFEHLGYRPYRQPVEAPGQGYGVPMALVYEDYAHLREVGSPFYTEATRWRNRKQPSFTLVSAPPPASALEPPAAMPPLGVEVFVQTSAHAG